MMMRIANLKFGLDYLLQNQLPVRFTHRANHVCSRNTLATRSARARDAVKPGDSTPNKLQMPDTPCRPGARNEEISMPARMHSKASSECQHSQVGVALQQSPDRTVGRRRRSAAP